jgi:hypothetical protein
MLVYGYLHHLFSISQKISTIRIFSGWWFGTFGLFYKNSVGNVMIPTDFHTFLRGVGIPTNQFYVVKNKCGITSCHLALPLRAWVARQIWEIRPPGSSGHHDHWEHGDV